MTLSVIWLILQSVLYTRCSQTRSQLWVIRQVHLHQVLQGRIPFFSIMIHLSLLLISKIRPSTSSLPSSFYLIQFYIIYIYYSLCYSLVLFFNLLTYYDLLLFWGFIYWFMWCMWCILLCILYLCYYVIVSNI